MAPNGVSIPAPIFGSATPEAVSAARVVAPLLAMEPVHEGCVAAGLSGDEALRVSLGTDPRSSDRWDDVVALYGRCVQQSTMAQQFASGIASTPTLGGREVSSEQLECLRDGYAALPPEVVASVMRAGLNPDTSDDGATQPVSQLLSQCGVDPAFVQPPGVK